MVSIFPKRQWMSPGLGRQRPEVLVEIENVPTLTTRELAELFDVSNAPIENHLRQLGKKNRAEKWVSDELSQSNKTARVNLRSYSKSARRRISFIES